MSDNAITVKHLSKKFILHHEKKDSIFEAATSIFQKKQRSQPDFFWLVFLLI